MNVAVVGGRTFNDSIHYHRLALVLDILKDGLGSYTIVSGGAIGADSFGERYAKENDLKTIIHLPDWDKHGKAAGMIRNKDIIADADMVVACWDGKSRGTANSIQLAKDNKKTTIMIYY